MKASLGAKSLPRPLEWLKKAGVGRWPLIRGRGQAPATARPLCSLRAPGWPLSSPSTMTCYGRRSQWPRFPEAAADIALSRAPAPGSRGGSRGFVPQAASEPGGWAHGGPRARSLALPRILRLSQRSASLFTTYVERGYFVQMPRDLAVTVETAVPPK